MRSYLTALAAAIALGAIYGSQALTGIPFWLALSTGVTAGCLALCGLAVMAGRAYRTCVNTTTLVVSLLLTLTLAEVGFAVYEQYTAQLSREDTSVTTGPMLAPGALDEQAQARMIERLGLLVLPEAWQRKRVADTPHDYYWHGVLHELDDSYFRRKTPFPPKRDGVLRIVTVGDSLTYGAGIASEHTYSARLEYLLAQHRPVEVLNLGVSGHQSADVLEKLKFYLPRLQPDVVVYGICLNDFLPSGIGQYNVDAYAFPLPEGLKTYFIEHSRIGKFVADRYNQLLLSYGYRVDFMDDILTDFDGYQRRFGEDIDAMAELVIEQHKLPFISLVLHQTPAVDGRAQQAALVAEELARRAGIQVIPSAAYFEAYDGRNLAVSRWEGHPNELANALFASLFYREIMTLELDSSTN